MDIGVKAIIFTGGLAALCVSDFVRYYNKLRKKP